MYSQMNCLIENEYIREKTEKTGKKSWRTLLRGGFIIVNRELAYFIAGGFINAMWPLYTYTPASTPEYNNLMCRWL